MLTPATLSITALSILATSILSGVVGMAGGMILMGVLLMLMPVAAAMVLHGVTQVASNGWRAFLWRSYIDWRIIGGYAIGSFAMFLAMKLVAALPGKATVYIAMGVTPFIVMALPKAWAPDIRARGMSVVCGAAVMFVQLLAGVAGNVLDVFFQRAEMDRRAVVATKAASQVLAHLQRIAFFGAFALSGDIFPLWVYGGAVAIAMLGATLAASVLKRMSDKAFRGWSQAIILAVSVVYLAKGLWLMVSGQ
jgi:uncharacterized membrane protein YfcA